MLHGSSTTLNRHCSAFVRVDLVLSFLVMIREKVLARCSFSDSVLMPRLATAAVTRGGWQGRQLLGVPVPEDQDPLVGELRRIPRCKRFVTNLPAGMTFAQTVSATVASIQSKVWL